MKPGLLICELISLSPAIWSVFNLLPLRHEDKLGRQCIRRKQIKCFLISIKVINLVGRMDPRKFYKKNKSGRQSYNINIV